MTAACSSASWVCSKRCRTAGDDTTLNAVSAIRVVPGVRTIVRVRRRRHRDRGGNDDLKDRHGARPWRPHGPAIRHVRAARPRRVSSVPGRARSLPDVPGRGVAASRRGRPATVRRRGVRRVPAVWLACAFSMRRAISPDRSALPFRRFESAGRVTRSTAAAAVTVRPWPPMSSIRITVPTCGGFSMGIVVVLLQRLARSFPIAPPSCFRARAARTGHPSCGRRAAHRLGPVKIDRHGRQPSQVHRCRKIASTALWAIFQTFGGKSLPRGLRRVTYSGDYNFWSIAGHGSSR